MKGASSQWDRPLVFANLEMFKCIEKNNYMEGSLAVQSGKSRNTENN